VVKIMFLLKRKPGLSRAEFREHYEEVYVPLALSLYPTIRKHVRNYIIPDDIHTDPAEPDLDCVVEVWFDDMEGYQSMIDAGAGDAGQADIHCQRVFLDVIRPTYSFVEEVES